MEDKEYFIATKNEDGDDVIYESIAYKLSELEVLNLIKICLKEERSKTIGRKLLDAYTDSTQNRKELTQKRLELIGIKNGKQEPTVVKKSRIK